MCAQSRTQGRRPQRLRPERKRRPDTLWPCVLMLATHACVGDMVPTVPVNPTDCNRLSQEGTVGALRVLEEQWRSGHIPSYDSFRCSRDALLQSIITPDGAQGATELNLSASSPGIGEDICCAVCLESIVVSGREGRAALVEACLHPFCLDCILEWAMYSEPKGKFNSEVITYEEAGPLRARGRSLLPSNVQQRTQSSPLPRIIASERRRPTHEEIDGDYQQIGADVDSTGVDSARFGEEARGAAIGVVWGTQTATTRVWGGRSRDPRCSACPLCKRPVLRLYVQQDKKGRELRQGAWRREAAASLVRVRLGSLRGSRSWRMSRYQHE